MLCNCQKVVRLFWVQGLNKGIFEGGSGSPESHKIRSSSMVVYRTGYEFQILQSGPYEHSSQIRTVSNNARNECKDTYNGGLQLTENSVQLVDSSVNGILDKILSTEYLVCSTEPNSRWIATDGNFVTFVVDGHENSFKLNDWSFSPIWYF